MQRAVNGWLLNVACFHGHGLPSHSDLFLTQPNHLQRIPPPPLPLLPIETMLHMPLLPILRQLRRITIFQLKPPPLLIHLSYRRQHGSSSALLLALQSILNIRPSLPLLHRLLRNKFLQTRPDSPPGLEKVHAAPLRCSDSRPCRFLRFRGGRSRPRGVVSAFEAVVAELDFSHYVARGRKVDDAGVKFRAGGGEHHIF